MEHRDPALGAPTRSTMMVEGALYSALLVAATVLIWFIERDNPRTLQPLGAGDQPQQLRRSAGDQPVVGHRRMHLGEAAAAEPLGGTLHACRRTASVRNK